jgi:hypothetical protein
MLGKRVDFFLRISPLREENKNNFFQTIIKLIKTPIRSGRK